MLHKCFEGSGLKWTAVCQSGRSRVVKLDGPKDLKWTVQRTQSERSAKVDGPERKKLDGPKERNWTVIRNESRRSKRLEMDGPKGSKWTVQKNVRSKEKQLGDQQG